MKPYPGDLLGPWPGDQGPASLPARARARALFPRLHAEAGEVLPWLADTAQTIGQPEDEGAFDALGLAASAISVSGEIHRYTAERSQILEGIALPFEI